MVRSRPSTGSFAYRVISPSSGLVTECPTHPMMDSVWQFLAGAPTESRCHPLVNVGGELGPLGLGQVDALGQGDIVPAVSELGVHLGGDLADRIFLLLRLGLALGLRELHRAMGLDQDRAITTRT